MTSTASSTVSTQLVGVDGARGGLIITNTDPYRLYVLLDGGTASETNYSFFLDNGETSDPEVTKGYTGPVNGIWSANGPGAALVTTWGR